MRRHCPQAAIEVLVPDFGGELAAIQRVLAARPDVLNHNLETVARLYPRVQPGKSYRRSLGLLSRAGQARLITKSGLMLALAETRGEVLAAIRDLRRAGCDVLTLGQYLQPTPRHLPVAEYIHPEKSAWYEETGLALGFGAVAAGPLVRSSYHAAEVGQVARASARRYPANS